MGLWLRSGFSAWAALLIVVTPAFGMTEPVVPPVIEQPVVGPAPTIVPEPVVETPPIPLPQAEPTPRIIAIGDLHGDHAAFRAIVEDAGLVNADGAWIGGDAILVQTGDVPDRGPDSLQIIRDLMRLQGEANAAGGRVVTLLGNHEAMNVIGDLRYVHEGEYAVFRDDRSGRRRRQYYEAHQEEIERSFRQREPALSEDQIRRRWIEQRPHGAVELLDAYGPDGEIGRWLASNPAIVKIGDTLFVHGGISAANAAQSIAEINAQVAIAIATRDDSLLSIINDPTGPLWYRGYFLRMVNGEPARVAPEDAEPEIDLVLDAYGARRIVVGHTTSLGTIRISLDGRLIAIDTGISAYYGGTRTYLEIRGETVITHAIGGEGGS